MNNQAQPLSLQRRLVSYKTSAAWREIPHVCYQYEPDVTEFFQEYQVLRQAYKEKGVAVSVNTLMLKAVTLGLLDAPVLNAAFTYHPEDYSGEIRYNSCINLGVPWLLPDGGMITLTVFGTDSQGLSQIAGQVEDIRARVEKTDFDKLFLDAARAKPGDSYGRGEGLSPQDITGGTVTVSNIGSICRSPGAFSLLEILPPQVFAVGISAVQERPGVFTNKAGEKEIGIRKIMPMCLAFDHRVLDFSDLVPFLSRMDKLFQNPQEMHNW